MEMLSNAPSHEHDQPDKARRLLEKLARCEQRYRWAHDTHGGGSLAAGQAWDRMRAAGHQAREYLNQLSDQEA